MAGLEKKFYAPKNKGSRGPSPVSASGNGHFARWKVIRILDLEKLFLAESNFLEFFFLWNPESWTLESRIQLREFGIPLTIGIRNPSSSVGSSLVGKVFLRFFPPVKIQHFQVSIRYRTHGHV